MKPQACNLCTLSLTAAAVSLPCGVLGFVRISPGPTIRISAIQHVRPASISAKAERQNTNDESLEEEEECSLSLNDGNAAGICSQFKILTCTSKACSQKRQILQMDQYATFSALYSRKEEAGGPYAMVDVEESPCLGRCKLAPCVAVEHEDYVGTVGLVGMTDAELNDRVFHRCVCMIHVHITLIAAQLHQMPVFSIAAAHVL